MPKWRSGLGAATNPERSTLLDAEWIARQRSVTDAYEKRCFELESLLVDARDLAVRACTVKWSRHKGALWIVIRVHHRAPGLVTEYRWRVPRKAAA